MINTTSIEVQSSANLPAPLNLPTPFWYQQPGRIEHRFYGVFEGGGAKGVAYVGALRAMKDRKCWFKGVAGASAGAITATLVAAGLDPEEMETATDNALDNFKVKFWAGLKRLRNETGYFDPQGLRYWLDETLKKQMVTHNHSHDPEEAVTFRQLFEATKIDLYIIATDLSLKRQMIFNHVETPNCSVADAVVASSSIPFAFPSHLLKVTKKEDEFYHHTMVDGGVWSNFPTFIFDDPAFRKHYGRERLDEAQVLGFLLDEAGEEPYLKGEKIEFDLESRYIRIRAREWYGDNPTQGDCSGCSVINCTKGRERGGDNQTKGTPFRWFLAKLGVIALVLFGFLSGFFKSYGVGERGRWPRPRKSGARVLVDGVNGLLGGFAGGIFGLLACFTVGLGAWIMIKFFTNDLLISIHMKDWSHPMAYVSLPLQLMLVLTAIIVPVLFMFIVLLVLSTNYLLLRCARKILYGLVTTYAAGSSSPAWVKERSNVIALPIPSCITTLSFDMCPECRERMISDAQQVTDNRLEEMLFFKVNGVGN